MRKGYTGLAFYLILIVLTTGLVHAQYTVVVLEPSAGFNETDGQGVGGIQRVGSGRIAGGPLPENTHALLWLGSSQTPIDLHPPGWTYSIANDTDGNRQTGAVWTGNPGGPIGKTAALWSGSANTFVALCEFQICGSFSEAFAIAGDQQVGYADFSFNGGGGRLLTRDIRASLWRGTPQSYVDLHPVTLGPSDETRAFDTDGIRQVGFGYFNTSPRPYHALMWTGTRESVVDLSPTTFDASFARATAKGVQAGYGMTYTGGGYDPPHALIWFGTAASVVDLGLGVIYDTNGTQHVGRKGFGYQNHAFRWDGTSGAGFDLHSLLPPGAYVNSGAERIDAKGNIIGWAQRSDTYFLVAVVWQPKKPSVPNPFIVTD